MSEKTTSAPKPFRVGYATEDQKREAVEFFDLVRAPGLEIGVVSGNTNEAVSNREKFTRKIAGKKVAEGVRTATADQRRRINNALVATLLKVVRVKRKPDQPIEWPGLGIYEPTPEFHEKMLNGYPDFRDEVNEAVATVTAGEEEAEGGAAKN